MVPKAPADRLRDVNFHDFLVSAIVFLAAAVLAVPLFRRFGLSAVLGYLTAGILIGPQAFGFVADTGTVLTFSELGVVLLLFIIGLELSPARLWLMRRVVLGAGGIQVVATAMVIALGIRFLGLDWPVAVLLGLGLALSSTAVDLQILAERRELALPHGRFGLGVLLFQDVAAIPVLAMVPFLAAAGLADDTFSAFGVLRVVAVIVAVALVGRFLLRPLFRIVSRARSVEVFTATTLLVAFGTAFLTHEAGLSMALGAFLAGVLLADSEYRHEIESHIEPFKGLLLGLFFMGVGMSIDLALAVAKPLPLLAAVAALLTLKSIVVYAVARLWSGLGHASAVRAAALLCQGGEFGFIAFTEASRIGVLDGATYGLLLLTVSMSMALTPFLVIAAERLVSRSRREADPSFDEIRDDHPKVIIAGFGRMGQIIARILRAQGIPFTALENSPEQIEVSRRFGNKIYFGDPSRAELLRAAGADRAEVFVLTTDDPDTNLRTARLVRHLYPQMRIIARARNRQHAFRLMDLGIGTIIRETFHSSLEMSRLTLEALGLDHQTAWRRTEQFREHDEQVLKTQHLVYDDEGKLVQTSREAFEDLQALFEADRK